MNKAKLTHVNPVLPTKDVGGAIDFYVEQLGFAVLFRDNISNPTFAGIGRDGVELHLQWHNAGEWDRVERPMLRIRVDNIANLFLEFAEKGVFHVNTKLRKTEWQTEEFAFYDPDSNGLTFFRALENQE